MSDGKLIFDTKIDTTGFEKDAKKLEGTKVCVTIDSESVKEDIREAIQDSEPPKIALDVDTEKAESKIEEIVPETKTVTVVVDDKAVSSTFDAEGKLIGKEEVEVPVTLKPDPEEIQKRIDDHEAYLAEVNAAIDTKQVEEQVQHISPPEVTIPTDADTSGASQDIESLSPSPVEIDTTADTSPAQSKIDSVDASPVEIPVDVDMTGADEAMKSLGERLHDWADQNATMIGTAIGNFVGNMATELVGNIWNGIKDAANAGDEIDKNSQKMGLSREGYQEWGYVLRQNGSDVKSLQSGMTQLNNTVDKAKKGNKDAAKQFSRLGIELEDLNEMSREEAFNAVVEGLQGIDDEGEKAALATALFGDSAVELLPTLNQAATDTAALKQEAHELGAVMSDEAVGASVEFNDNLDKMQTAWDGISTQLLTLVMPLFTGFFDIVSGVLGGINSLFGSSRQNNELLKDLDEAYTAADNFKEAVDKVKTDYSNTMITITVKYEKAQELIDDLKALQEQGTLTEEEVKKMQEISASLVELYPGLEDYIGADGIIHAEAGELQGLIDKWKALDEQVAMSSMILSIQNASVGMDVNLQAYQQMADDYHKAWIDAVAKLAETSDMSISAQTISNRLTYAGLPDDAKLKAIEAAQSFVKGFKDAYGDEFDALELPDAWDLINASAEDIEKDPTLKNSLVTVMETIQAELNRLKKEQTTSEQELSDAAVKAREKYAETLESYSGTMEEVTAMQKVYLKKFCGYTDETLADQMQSNETMAQTIARLYDEARKDAEGATEALKSEGEQQDEAVAGMDDAKDEAEDNLDETGKLIDEQGEQISELEASALTVEQLNADIQTALENGKTAQQALADAKTQVKDDAKTILDDMNLYITNLGTYVTAMKDEMVKTIDDAKTEAAAAGRNFAKGAADGYTEKTPLKDNVMSTTEDALRALSTYWGEFRSTGAEMMRQMADGVSANAGVLADAMSAAVSDALAAAQSAAGSNSVFRSANRWYGHRTGLEYVPYDEYPALLHRGESVLTASEAALWRGGAIVRDVSPEPIDYDALAAAIWRSAPDDGGLAISVNLDSEEIANVLEPTISSLQGRRLALQRR